MIRKRAPRLLVLARRSVPNETEEKEKEMRIVAELVFGWLVFQSAAMLALSIVGAWTCRSRGTRLTEWGREV